MAATAGSGKTYTMLGAPGSFEQRGLAARTVHEVHAVSRSILIEPGCLHGLSTCSQQTLLEHAPLSLSVRDSSCLRRWARGPAQQSACRTWKSTRHASPTTACAHASPNIAAEYLRSWVGADVQGRCFDLLRDAAPLAGAAAWDPLAGGPGGLWAPKIASEEEALELLFKVPSKS